MLSTLSAAARVVSAVERHHLRGFFHLHVNSGFAIRQLHSKPGSFGLGSRAKLETVVGYKEVSTEGVHTCWVRMHNEGTLLRGVKHCVHTSLPLAQQSNRK